MHVILLDIGDESFALACRPEVVPGSGRVRVARSGEIVIPTGALHYQAVLPDGRVTRSGTLEVTAGQARLVIDPSKDAE